MSTDKKNRKQQQGPDAPTATPTTAPTAPTGDATEAKMDATPTPAPDAPTGDATPAPTPAPSPMDVAKAAHVAAEARVAEALAKVRAIAERIALGDDSALAEIGPAQQAHVAARNDASEALASIEAETFVPTIRSAVEALLTAGTLVAPAVGARVQVALIFEGGKLHDVRRVTIGATRAASGDRAPRPHVSNLRVSAGGRDGRAAPVGWWRQLTVLGHSLTVRFVDPGSNALSVSTDGRPWAMHGSPSSAIQKESGSAPVNGWDKLGLMVAFSEEEARKHGWHAPSEAMPSSVPPVS